MLRLIERYGVGWVIYIDVEVIKNDDRVVVERESKLVVKMFSE